MIDEDGNFLVSLRKFKKFTRQLTKGHYSANIVLCRSLLKQNVCIWENYLLRRQQVSKNEDFTQRFEEIFNQEETENLYLFKESEEVAVTVAGYIAKK